MAAPQERRPTPIFTVFESEESDSHTLLDDQPTGLGCFRSFPCFGSTREPPSGAAAAAWIGNRVKSVREFTEVVSGPKWKNLVRKVGSYFTGHKKRRGVQYDSFDYALNFDDGLHEEEERERLVRGFSTRFAAAPKQPNSGGVTNT